MAKGKIIGIIAIIIICAIFFFTGDSHEVEKTTIIPSNDSGEYISKMDGEFGGSVENAEDGEVYYLYEYDMMKLYQYNHGNWSKPFEVTYENGTVNMNTHARIVNNVYTADGQDIES